MQIPTRSAAINRLKLALTKTNDPALRDTINNMILAERARSVSTRGNDGVNNISKPQRTVYNARRASIKLKNELYDTRIDLDSPEEIAQRRADFVQKRKVFSRG